MKENMRVRAECRVGPARLAARQPAGRVGRCTAWVTCAKLWMGMGDKMCATRRKPADSWRGGGVRFYNSVLRFWMHREIRGWVLFKNYWSQGQSPEDEWPGCGRLIVCLFIGGRLSSILCSRSAFLRGLYVLKAEEVQAVKINNKRKWKPLQKCDERGNEGNMRVFAN